MSLIVQIRETSQVVDVQKNSEKMVKNATVSLPPPLDEVGKKREMKINDRETKEKIKKEKDELDEKDSAQHKTLKEWIDEHSQVKLVHDINNI